MPTLLLTERGGVGEQQKKGGPPSVRLGCLAGCDNVFLRTRQRQCQHEEPLTSEPHSQKHVCPALAAGWILVQTQVAAEAAAALPLFRTD